MSDAAQSPSDQERLRAMQLMIRAMQRNASITTKSISQRVELSATPHEVYDAILDSAKHTAFTGAKADIQPHVMGEVSAYDGKLHGIITELLEDQHIVMAWQAVSETWPEDHYSVATFMLRPEGKGTTLVFFQQEVPEAAREEIANGWQTHYWDKLKAYF